jgi:hypothetical protein
LAANNNKMTTEEFAMMQEEMTDLELVDLAEKQVSNLAKTGGRSHTMTVPPRVDDTDMIFSVLIKRFKKKIEI